MMRLTLLALVMTSAPAFAGPELTKAYILSILKDAKPDLDECGKDLKGDVVKTHFVIATSGDVTDIKLDGKHAKDAVGICVKAKIASL
ncbi:MAG TPA: hypothetical protein VGO62_06090, partial [Myxococcota bacterium]